mmetsp:Transcript_80693/g.211832  ORF Transcript_80693/g.211832 Transcript_80693/m.211832 type:complete len:438 (+) Transcript_80693:92-1405(+)
MAPKAAAAKAKAAAAAPPAPEPEPAKPAAQPAAKASGKAAAKASGKAAAKPAAPLEEEVRVTKVEQLIPTAIDDGTGGDWEVSTGLSKKAGKAKEKKDQEAAIQMAVTAQLKAQGFKPGMQNAYIPGMGPAPTGKAASTAKDIAPEVQAAVARALAAAAAAGKAAAGGAAAPAAESGSTATIKVPEAKIGRVIGPKGGNIKMIQEKTGVTRIDTSGEVFTITGPPAAVALAETAIRDLIEKGYTSMAFDDFAENFVKVHPSSFPDLIGKEGCVVKAIKKETGCEINFPDVPKNSAGNKTYKVMLAGSAVSVEKAKDIINDICTYYHHPVTHPGQVHEELDVEEWCLRFIIGKAGSEMKHIQHNWKVKVNVPREYSANQKVVIVGEKDPVERAKTYIEKLIWNAQNQSKGRDKQDTAAADFDDEGPEEDWMKQYLYKR